MPVVKRADGKLTCRKRPDGTTQPDSLMCNLDNMSADDKLGARCVYSEYGCKEWGSPAGCLLMRSPQCQDLALKGC